MSPKRRIIPVFIPHLGCPNGCVFCNQRSISGKMEPVKPEMLAGMIKAGLAAGPPGSQTELAFYGGSFTAIPAEEREALLKSALPFIRSGALSSIRVSTRPDAIHEQALSQLWEYGVRTIELGAQSMSDRVLKASGRGHSERDTVNAAGLVKARGFALYLQMMTGLPGDSDEGAVASARKIAGLGPDGVRIYPAVILKDTPLYHMWKRGEYQEHTIADAVRVCARLLPIFQQAGIPVIRLGLNPTAELSGGLVAGGAYHPALGELARSAVLLQTARKALAGTSPGDDVILGVNKRQLSAAIGQKRGNTRRLQGEFQLHSLKFIPGPVEEGAIVLISIAKK